MLSEIHQRRERCRYHRLPGRQALVGFGGRNVPGQLVEPVGNDESVYTLESRRELLVWDLSPIVYPRDLEQALLCLVAVPDQAQGEPRPRYGLQDREIHFYPTDVAEIADGVDLRAGPIRTQSMKGLELYAGPVQHRIWPDWLHLLQKERRGAGDEVGSPQEFTLGLCHILHHARIYFVIVYAVV